MNLTRRQSEILTFIQQYMQDTGYPPTRAEIAKHLGFSSINAAVDHLKALERKGVIELLSGTSRGIRLLVSAERGLPVVGRVAAGHPILAQEHIETHYEVDASMFRPQAHYLLRVEGMSMRDAGILDGDLVAVHRTQQAENGQIIVARLGDEVTVKRFWRHGRWSHRVRLLPENPEFSPIEVDLREQELVIEGRAVGLIRDQGEWFAARLSRRT